MCKGPTCPGAKDARHEMRIARAMRCTANAYQSIIPINGLRKTWSGDVNCKKWLVTASDWSARVPGEPSSPQKGFAASPSHLAFRRASQSHSLDAILRCTHFE